MHYIDLLGLEQVKIFEIGKIFREGNEADSLVIGIKNHAGFKGKMEDEEVENISNLLSGELGVKIESEFSKDGILEINFDKMIENLPMPESYKDIKIEKYDIKRLKYKRISLYPFVLRDIAIFVPEGVIEKDVALIVEREAGELLVNKRLFDVFVKKLPDGTPKTSFAFRLVFQSQEKTLSDEEVNKIMGKISNSLNGHNGWQVR